MNDKFTRVFYSKKSTVQKDLLLQNNNLALLIFIYFLSTYLIRVQIKLKSFHFRKQTCIS